MRRQVDLNWPAPAPRARSTCWAIALRVAPVLERSAGGVLERIHEARRERNRGRLSAVACLPRRPPDLEEMAGNLMDNACKWAASRIDEFTARGRGRRSLGARTVEVARARPAPAYLDRSAAQRRGAPRSGLGNCDAWAALCRHCPSDYRPSLPDPGGRRGRQATADNRPRFRSRAPRGCARGRAQIVQHRSDRSAIAQHVERARGAGAGQVMVDLAAHDFDLTLHRLGGGPGAASASLASTVKGVLR